MMMDKDWLYGAVVRRLSPNNGRESIMVDDFQCIVGLEERWG